MKSKIFTLLLASTMIIAACDNSSDDLTDMNNDDMSQTMASSKWKVSYFWDDEDETYHYDGYEFEFSETGTLTASKGDTHVTGTWSISSSSSGKDFNIQFTSPEIFEELSDDWDIIEFSDTTIKLEDVSGGDGSIDKLHFTKI